MTEARMPLARRLMDGEGAIAMRSGEDLEFSRKDVEDWALVDVQVADDLVYDLAKRRGSRGWIDIRSDMGIVHPPYPATWMEWGMGDIRLAALAVTSEFFTDSLEDDQVAITIFFANDIPGTSIVCADAFYIMTIKPDGMIDCDERRPYWRLKGDGDGWKDEEDESRFSQTVMVALYGLTLMNCRNVRTETSGAIKMRRSGRQKRQGLKPFEVRYNTIVLPGGGSQRAGSGASSHHRASALHRVRGHFKTFTADKPLMGKHTGTYWWGWSLRGDPEHGIVESNYLVGDSA